MNDWKALVVSTIILLLSLGMTKLKFKPAYNPYTEPSMEIFRWVFL